MKRKLAKKMVGFLLSLAVVTGMVAGGGDLSLVYAAEASEFSAKEEADESDSEIEEETTTEEAPGEEEEEEAEDSVEEVIEDDDDSSEDEDAGDEPDKVEETSEEESSDEGEIEVDEEEIEVDEEEIEVDEEEIEEDLISSKDSSSVSSSGEITIEETMDGSIDNDELFAAYFNSILYENIDESESADDGIATVADYGSSYFDYGTGSYTLYNALKSSVVDIAANGGSTVVTLSTTAKFTYTNTDEEDGDTFLSDSVSDMKAQLKEVMVCLNADYPYEMYWYGNGYSYSYGYSGSTSGTLTLYISKVSMKVATAYQGTDSDGSVSAYVVDPDIATTASQTVERAASVVDQYKDCSDYNKLVAYKDWICDNVSYNSDYSDYYNTYGYGDPWQVIYVFDGDEDTNVVCEGYAKAFQYLCDLSTFTENIVCYTVSGVTTGNHMWNIVTMEDGLNYLVDVTAVDTSSLDGYFLAGTEEGSVEEGYYFYVSQTFTTGTYSYTRSSSNTYYYDDDTISLYGESGILTLATSGYGNEEAQSLEITSMPEDVEITYGESAELSVAATSSGDLSYQWYETGDGEDSALEDADEETLILIGLDAGTYYYYCEVSDGSDTLVSDTATVTVLPVGLDEAVLTLDATSYTYTGAAITPGVTVMLVDTVLEEETDYEVTYSDNTDPGTATVTVTGTGNYTGSAETFFTIESSDGTVSDGSSGTDSDGSSGTVSDGSSSTTDISNATITLSKTSYTYTGAARKPTVTVVLEGTTLTSGTDYSVAYSDNVNVGTATVTVIGKGDYSGTITQTYTITAKSISDATVMLSSSSYTYTGSAKKPTAAVTLTLNSENVTLTSGADYTVAYSNNVDAGTGTVTITGTGNYKGTAKATFTINQKSVSSATVELSSTSYTYTGSAKKPTASVSLTVGSTEKMLTSGTDYSIAYSDNINAGTGTVTITGKGNYKGTAKATFTINAKSISGATITLSKVSYTYSGNANKPTVGVVLSINNTTRELTKGTDYTVTYSDNTDVGTATVTVKGTGNYKGTATTTFTINQKAISSADISLSKTSYTYTGNERKPTATVTMTLSSSTVTLVKGTDYTIYYTNNVDAGEATVTIMGHGNYKGTATTTFTINQKSIADAEVSLSKTSYTYSGTAKKPTATVVITIDGVSTTLTAGTDYSVSYSNNVNVGTGKITIKGKGNYKGTTTATFTIN